MDTEMTVVGRAVPNPPGTANSGELNPITARTPLEAGATPVQGTTITPQNIPLKDWQAALFSYIAFVWMAEVPTLAPFAVALAWGTAIIYAIQTNLPKSIADGMQQGAGTEGNTNAITAIVPEGQHPPGLGQQ